MKFANRSITTIAAHIGRPAGSWFRVLRTVALLLALPIGTAFAAQLTLTWQDNSDDELGFNIERSDNGAAFVQIATVAPNTTTYVDTSIVPGTNYSYRVAAFNAIGNSPYSNAATNAPAVATSPASQNVTAFQTVTFTVAATGVPAPSYQWQKGGVSLSDGVGASGVAVSGSTTATLTLTGVRVADAGAYTVVASNGIAPNATSSPATLTVAKSPQTITFSLNAIVTYSPGGVYPPGATSSSGLPISYSSSNPSVATVISNTVTIAGAGVTTITASQAGDANYLPATSANQNLTVNQASQTITFPAFPPIAVGSPPITLNATSSSGLPITYLSLDTSVATISGNILTIVASTSNAVNIRATQGGNANYVGANFVEQRLTIAPAGFPLFTTQPTDQTIAPGGTTAFTVVVTGTPTPTLQWQVSTDGGGTWTNLTNTAPYSGVTTATLTITGATVGLNTNQYQCVATNSVGVGASNSATLTVGVPAAPTFSTQPVSQAATVGATVILTAIAGGIPTPSLQWQISTDGGGTWSNLTNITPYSGVTTRILTITGVSLGQSGSQYRSVATNTQGVTNSNAATLTINGVAPVITSQPSAQSAVVGDTVTFFVGASGNPSPTVKWQVSTDGVTWTDLTNAGVYSGVTTTLLTLTNVSLGLNGNQYRSIATNTGGTAISSSAALTVSLTPSTVAPTFTSQPPADLKAAVNSSVTLSASASGTPAPTYQWQKNGANISGATNSSLTLNSLALTDTAIYTLVASNSSGTATSSTTLTVTTLPVITTQPISQVAAPGSTVTFTVAANGTPNPIYLWRKNGVDIPGANSPTLTLSNVTTADNAIYNAIVINVSGSTVSNGATLTVVSALAVSRVTNFSARAVNGTGPQALFMGFVVSGATKSILLRAVGPGLATVFNLSGVLADPQLSLYDGGTVIQSNDNWGGTAALQAAFTSTGAFPLASTSLDSALLTSLAPKSYTMQIGGGTGTVLTEIYDADPTPTPVGRLVNVSARASVSSGNNVLIIGFVVNGSTSVQMLIRASGPELASRFGLTGALTDPIVQLYSGSTLMQQNDDWGGTSALSTAFAQVGAFPFSSPTSKDSAMLTTLTPGVYTVVVSGVNGASGITLLEIYQMP